MSEATETLIRAIKSAGKSYGEIAAESGVHKSTISRLVARERAATLDTAERLAPVLGLRVVLVPTIRKGG